MDIACSQRGQEAGRSDEERVINTLVFRNCVTSVESSVAAPRIPELAVILRRRKGGTVLSNTPSQAMMDTSIRAIAQNTIASLSIHLIELLGLRHVTRLKMPKIELAQSKISDAVNRDGNGGASVE